MSKIIQMQEAFRSLQNLKQICSYNREMIDCPTRCLIHQEARIWLIESGRATVKIQEQKFELSTGNVVSILPWQMTEVIQVHESLRYDIIVYNYEYFNHIIKSLYNIDNESFCLTGLLKKNMVLSVPEEKNQNFRNIVFNIQEEMGMECLLRERGNDATPYVINQVVALILEIIRWGEYRQRISERENREIVKSDIFSYIFGHLNEKITLKQLSNLFYMSESTVSAYITQTTGLSFFDLLNEMRVVRTLDFLAYTDLNLEELAEILGFVDSAHISRVFMARTGLKVSEYRKIYGIVNELSRIKISEENYQIVSCIYRNYEKPLTAKIIADQIHISVKEVNRILLYFVEMNFTEFLNDIRVNRARQLLIKTQRSILEIALEVGYLNEKTLTRNFLKKFAMTPGQFRNNTLEKILWEKTKVSES